MRQVWPAMLLCRPSDLVPKPPNEVEEEHAAEQRESGGKQQQRERGRGRPPRPAGPSQPRPQHRYTL